MKKLLSTTLVMFLLLTNISFAEPLESTMLSIKDLNRIENDVGLVIRNIISCKYNEEVVRKTLDFDKNILSGIYSRSYVTYNTKESNTLNNRESDTIIYIASLYALAINGIILYLDDSDLNESYLLDSISQYQSGKVSLLELKNFLNKVHKSSLK